ncbi:rab11 family-interacting protein 3 isoform X1 [Xyrichtys novacula]|uniref:Rab11 family-interacting protein 3 isoform X1 n=1 Tax=Xyrichtys novacula TaxID=13765 RepID=A0AAV1H5D1_XYRNO|nr:rab11 family-interacting protein 3 isoform X1 [Xyrichtys novacula]
MEPTVVSGPLGHTQWESEQPFPLGFNRLDSSDNGDVLCPNKSGQAGLDFRDDVQDQTSKPNEEEKPLELDNLINIADFSCGAFQLDGEKSIISQTSLHGAHLEEFSFTDKTTGPTETLKWLFSPNLTNVVGETSKEQSLTHEDLVPPSKTSSINKGDPLLLVDLFSNEFSCPPLESSGELNPRGVSEELIDLLQEEQAGPPPLQSRETLSPETGDKGLCPDQVTDLPVACSTTLQDLPENSPPHDHISTLQESLQGSVPLLDLEVPDCESSLSLCPVSPPSVVCTGEPLSFSTEELQVEHKETTEIRDLTSEQPGENDSSTKSSSGEDSTLTVPWAEDAFTQGDFKGESLLVKNESEDLMEDKICTQGNEAMALDLCLTADEVHNKETLDLKPQEGVQEESIPGLTPEPKEQERSTDTNNLEGQDYCGVASLDFPDQDLHTPSSEPEWTREQTMETISLSKMGGDDSLPMVSAVNSREEDASPLKAVFDALDQDGDGFVRIEEFMEFAAAYGADQVKDFTKFLDPSGLGVISFEDFHRGISAISNGGPEPQLYNVNYSPGDGAVGCPEEYDEHNEVTDSAYLGSESTYSECETFTDEDTGALVPPEMHEDVETDSGIEATLHDPEDGGNRFSLNSELHNHSLVTVIGGEEEHFEDFGESNTSELLLESSVEGTEREADSSLEQPSEKVNGSSLLSPSAGKRLSSKKVARHLLQNSSMTLDTMSDLTRDILELADNDITDKVLLLERRVAELEKESEASGEQHGRLRQENLQLVHRANALEEQLKEQELHADEQMQQETRRHKEALVKLERERGLEVENIQARLQQMDEENSELRSCVPCLRANIERLEEEKRKLQDETCVMSDRLQDETESRQKMADKLSHERHQNQKEKESTQELIEDLRKQLEHLQLYKLEAEAKRGRTPGAGLQEYQTRTREAELEQEIKRLKQDNRSLKEQNDELNGQIINLSIQGAKNLMSASFSDSLAAEISSVSRAELMEAVHKQEEINYRLQDYIDKIIVAIMESNPSILEVK